MFAQGYCGQELCVIKYIAKLKELKMTGLFHTLTSFVLLAALALPAAAQDKAFSLVPENAVTVGAVHLAEMRTSPLSSVLFEHVDRMTSDGEAARFLLDAGLQPLRDVDLLVVATSPGTSPGSELDVLVIAEGAFNPQRLSTAIVSRGATRNGAYLILPEAKGENGAVAFLSPTLAIAGNERSVVRAMAARTSGGTDFLRGGTLAKDLRRVAPGATAWALIDVARLARLTNGHTIDTGNGQAGAVLQAAMKNVSSVALWAKDSGNVLHFGATSSSTDIETLQLLEDAVRGALAALRIGASEKAPEMVSVLRRFDIRRASDSMTVEGSIPAAIIRDLMTKQMAVAMKSR
jgi:hypothetical protein